MTQATDTDIREIKGAITALTQEMRIGFANIDRKIEVGFANVDTKFAEVDTKFAGVDTKLAKLDGKIDTLEAKFEERTRLGFWGFVFRAVVISVLAGIALLFVRYLFPGLANP